MIATEVLPILEKEAKERQAHGKTAPGKTLTQKVVEALHGGESTEQAVKLFSTNRQHVSDAKRIKEKDPKLAEEVRQGTKTIREGCDW